MNLSISYWVAKYIQHKLYVAMTTMEHKMLSITCEICVVEYNKLLLILCWIIKATLTHLAGSRNVYFATIFQLLVSWA